MEQLRERFVVLPLSYVVRALSGELELAHDAVAVTFDDGYRDVLLRAAPILRELEIPASVFVPTGFASADAPVGRLLPHDRLYAALWTARRDGVALASLGNGQGRSRSGNVGERTAACDRNGNAAAQRRRRRPRRATASRRQRRPRRRRRRK